MSKTITAYSFKRRTQVVYDRPSRKDALAYAQLTWGERYDPIERQKVTGCLPMVWPQRAAE